MDIFVFRRSEIKYMVNHRQRQALEQVLQEHMVPDAHKESLVCNVYYDTPDSRLIRRSLEKPVYKEKLRLRSYGAVTPEQTVFLELKKKYKGVVYKRRIVLPEAEATKCLAGSTPLPDSQIGREIDYFRKFYGDLHPAVYLCYDRTAYVGREDPGLRVTLDDNVRYRTHHLSLTAQPGGEQLLEPGQSLVEIKTPGAMPLWLVDELSRLQIRKISFSKYGTAYLRMLKRKLIESRGKNYA